MLLQTHAHAQLPARRAAALILAALGALALFAAAGARGADEIVIVADGRACAEIVAGADACPIARWSASEIQRVVELASGAKLAIVEKPSGNLVAIHVGKSDAAKRLGVDAEGIEREHIRILAKDRPAPGVIVIAGRDDPKVDPARQIEKPSIWSTFYDRGTIFAAYEFLERVAGARWYWPGDSGEAVPRGETLTFPAIDLRQAPYMPERLMWAGTSRDGLLWMLRLRRSSWHRPNMHSFHRLGLLARFGETHPEYFALLPDGSRDTQPRRKHYGHLTFSNEALAEEISLDAISYFKGEGPEVRGIINHHGQRVWDPNAAYGGYFNLMQQDGFQPSQEPGDKKFWSQGPQGASELLWQFFVKIVHRVEKEVDNAKWTCSAYGPARPVPQTVVIPDNVHVRVCYGTPTDFATGTFDQTKQLIADWYEKLGKRRVGNSFYMLMKRDGVPGFAFDYVARYYRELKDYLDGIHGYHERPEDNFSTHINWYMMARMGWDPSRSADEIMSEFYEKAFGPAAAPMRAFYEEMQELWVEKMVSNTIDTPLGPVARRPSVPDMWRTVYTPEVVERNTARFDEAERLAASAPLALARVRTIREKVFETMRRARAEFAQGIDQAASTVAYAAPASGKIDIDATSDEAAWNRARVLRTGLNKEDKDPAAPTEIRVLRDGRDLLISFICHEPHIERMVRTDPAPDKKRYNESSVEVFLGPVGDADQTVYQLLVDTHGTFNGLLHTKNLKTHRTWEPQATAAAKLGDDRWVCEIRLPLSSLGEHGQADEFLFNACRNRYVSGEPPIIEHSTWSPLVLGSFLQPWTYGRLKVVDEIPDLDAGNLLPNGSFETLSGSGQPRHWGRLGEGMSIDRENARFGMNCLRIEGAPAERRHPHRTIKDPALKPDTEYVLSFWAKTQDVEQKPVNGKIIGASGCGINMNLDGNRWFPVPSIVGTTPWRPYAYRFRTPEEPLKVAYIRLRLWWCTGTAWFDKVSLREAD